MVFIFSPQHLSDPACSSSDDQADTDKRILWYLIVLWLIFQPVLTTAHKFWNFSIKLSASLATGFVCYFILGYLLGEMTLSRRKIILSAVIWVISTLITIIGTYLLTRNAGRFDGFFYDFVSLNVILASGAAFILLRWISERRSFASANVQLSLRTLATSTFGIYLIHVIVIEVLRYGIPYFQVSSFKGNAIWSIPFASTVVFLLSFLIVHILQKIPILKHIVP